MRGAGVGGDALTSEGRFQRVVLRDELRHPRLVTRPARPDPRHLSALPFLTDAADPASRSLQRRALEALGISARERFAADSTASPPGVVAAGLGFSVLPAAHPAGPRGASGCGFPGPSFRCTPAGSAGFRTRWSRERSTSRR